ncbi:MAG: ABC transporter ATP-binding protein [Desulfobulbaceae bacterium]|nr:ABC transporter ATP-binding protein [Desulfobulbaceae bacterium]
MIIECRDLLKVYPVDGQDFRAVEGVSFGVEAGDFVTILGHSGSGKTTLLSLIGGLARPNRGQVLVDGCDCWAQSDTELAVMRNSTIGFIFQFSSLIPTLTVLENIILPLSFAADRTRDQESTELALELLDQVGLIDKGNAFPAQLSGGQQRRVAIARAFINRPRIILADEPTGDLDEVTEQEILKLFRHYNEKVGTTFLVVTHNRQLAESQHNPRTFAMKDGRLSEISAREC